MSRRVIVILIFAAILVIMALLGRQAVADGTYSDSWQQNSADAHAWDNKCCYCQRVDRFRPNNNGTTTYFKDGREFTIPNIHKHPHDPQTGWTGVWLCDPISKYTLCVLHGDAGVS